MWPVLLLILGGLALLPVPGIQAGDHLLHEVLLSGRLLDPRSLWSDAPEASALEERFRPDAELQGLIEASRRPYRPPAAWAGDGAFLLLAAGEQRDPERIQLGTRDAVPKDAPVLLMQPGPGGRPQAYLVGFALGGAGVRPAVAPITSSESRIAAWTGSRVGEEGLLFVAEGTGGPRLKVKGPETLQGLRDGDAVWVDPDFLRQGAHAWAPPPGELLFLGTLRQDPRFRDPEEEFQVELPWSLSGLQDLAVFFPPGFPDPVEPAFEPQELPVLVRHTQEVGRGIWTSLSGREQGVEPGLAVVADGVLLGRIWRAGWGVSQVREVSDAGFQQRVLLLQQASCRPWLLVVEGLHPSGSLRVRRVPPGTEEGALVVTSGADPSLPAGLLLGHLQLEDQTWVLRTPVTGTPPRVLRRKEGP